MRVLIDRNMDRSSQVENYKHGVRLTHMLTFPKIGINSIYVNVSKHWAEHHRVSDGTVFSVDAGFQILQEFQSELDSSCLKYVICNMLIKTSTKVHL